MFWYAVFSQTWGFYLILPLVFAGWLESPKAGWLREGPATWVGGGRRRKEKAVKNCILQLISLSWERGARKRDPLHRVTAKIAAAGMQEAKYMQTTRACIVVKAIITCWIKCDFMTCNADNVHMQLLAHGDYTYLYV